VGQKDGGTKRLASRIDDCMQNRFRAHRKSILFGMALEP
jgi:hypothetical protein